MANEPRFLLGYGERLTKPVELAKGGRRLKEPYTFAEAQARVAPMVKTAADTIAKLPDAACPEDYAVSLITLHPQYTAKSYFPGALLDAVRMQTIGSRPGRVTPEKVRQGKQPKDSTEDETVELYVSGRRSDLQALARSLPNWTEASPGAKELFEVEAFRPVEAKDRIIRPEKWEKEPLLEVILHTDAQLSADRIIEAFEAYAEDLDLTPDLDRRFEVGGLCFLPLRAPREKLEDIGKFAFLRSTRQMPKLRQLRPLLRSVRSKSFSVAWPSMKPVDDNLRVAVFDGGVAQGADFGGLVTLHEDASLGPATDDGLDHGTAVTSAVLFGPLKDKLPLEQPYGSVDHFRVLDNDSGREEDLFDVLERIKSVLEQRRYQFVNLSLGPKLPIEDTEVHVWTAVLDELLCTGETVLTVAVGNDGDLDWDAGLARVQVPSDLVNALSVGSADSLGQNWGRAPYSCIGPGRSPGRIKPDVVAFGGANSEPFYVFDKDLNRAVPEMGTSFASPMTLRQAMGVRAHFGDKLSPLAIKALIVHCSQEHKALEKRETGWGRVPQHLDDLVVCEDGVTRVVYQGELSPSGARRILVPLPSTLPKCKVRLKATFCIASRIYPQDPSNYTQSGLDITFRPDADKRGEDAMNAKSKSFFRLTDYDNEKQLRHNAHKWETVMHAECGIMSSSLKEPAFDVQYQQRIGGKALKGGDKIKYALIITVMVPKMPTLYDEIVRRYQTQLEPLQPRVRIRTRT